MAEIMSVSAFRRGQQRASLVEATGTFTPSHTGFGSSPGEGGGERDRLDSETIEACVDAISRQIVPGTLPGNGFDETAKRNGLICAQNVLYKMLSDNER